MTNSNLYTIIIIINIFFISIHKTALLTAISTAVSTAVSTAKAFNTKLVLWKSVLGMMEIRYYLLFITTYLSSPTYLSSQSKEEWNWLAAHLK